MSSRRAYSSPILHLCPADRADLFFVTERDRNFVNFDSFKRFILGSFFSAGMCRYLDRILRHFRCGLLLFLFCLIEQVYLSRDFEMMLLAGRAEEFFRKEINLLLQIISLLAPFCLTGIGFRHSRKQCTDSLIQL